MDEIAKEIITADELKKYLAKQWRQRPCEYFNKTVKEFAEMKENEKVIWCLNLKFDSPSPNILLTNNYEIVFKAYQYDRNCIDYLNDEFICNDEEESRDFYVTFMKFLLQERLTNLII